MLVLRQHAVDAPVQLLHVLDREPYQVAVILVFLDLTREPATHRDFILFVVPLGCLFWFRLRGFWGKKMDAIEVRIVGCLRKVLFFELTGKVINLRERVEK